MALKSVLVIPPVCSSWSVLHQAVCVSNDWFVHPLFTRLLQLLKLCMFLVTIVLPSTYLAFPPVSPSVLVVRLWIWLDCLSACFPLASLLWIVRTLHCVYKYCYSPASRRTLLVKRNLESFMHNSTKVPQSSRTYTSFKFYLHGKHSFLKCFQTNNNDNNNKKHTTKQTRQKPKQLNSDQNSTKSNRQTQPTRRLIKP